MTCKILYMLTAMFLSWSIAVAQIPVEIYVGDKRATVDIMFFKYIKNKEGNNSRFLFFNRNRAGIDYLMTKTNNLPQFGFTEALSYNHEKLKGFAPVVVASILNYGVFPKAGVQFAKIGKNYTLFSWLVAETLKSPDIDFFFLGRYTPRLYGKINLFSQIELVNTFPGIKQNNFIFTQRFRLGLKIKEFQFGLGLDLLETGRDIFSTTKNTGGFLRYEF